MVSVFSLTFDSFTNTRWAKIISSVKTTDNQSNHMEVFGAIHLFATNFTATVINLRQPLANQLESIHFSVATYCYWGGVTDCDWIFSNQFHSNFNQTPATTHQPGNGHGCQLVSRSVWLGPYGVNSRKKTFKISNSGFEKLMTQIYLPRIYWCDKKAASNHWTTSNQVSYHLWMFWSINLTSRCPNLTLV